MSEKTKALSARDILTQSFANIEFEESSHKYWLVYNKDLNLTSATGLLKLFYEPFDENKMSTIVAKKESLRNKHIASKTIDKAYILRRWENIRVAATTSGSRVHEYAEYNYPNFPQKPRCNQEVGIKEFFDNLNSRYEVIYMELRMYDERLAICGTCDLILYDTLTNTLVLVDWKTNQVNIHKYYNDITLKKPFDSLLATDLNKYSLQLSVYQAIIERNTNLKVSERWIVHLDSTDWKQMDISKKHNLRYKLDIVDPDEYGENYRLYKTPNRSKKIIRHLYDKLNLEIDYDLDLEDIEAFFDDIIDRRFREDHVLDHVIGGDGFNKMVQEALRKEAAHLISNLKDKNKVDE